MIGEGCHFFDIFGFLTRARPISVTAAATSTDNAEIVAEDTATVVVTYSDGSVATLAYVANGSERIPKEYCEVSGEGKTALMSNFTRLELNSGRSRMKSSYKGGKGHQEEILHFLDVVRGRTTPEFGVDDLVGTTLASIAAVESMRTCTTIRL